MTNETEYSTKGTAIRGITRRAPILGSTMTADEMADKFLSAIAGGRFKVDHTAVDFAELAAKQGTVVLSDQDKRAVAEEANARRGANAVVITDDTDQDELDANLVQMCGYSHCPSCGIHLSNGVSDFDGMVDRFGSEKEAMKYQRHDWGCLGCNAEWGREITPAKASSRKEPVRHYTNKSTVDGAVQVVWDLCKAMPDARRKEVIAAAVEQGVAFYTARTQYQKWFKAQKANRLK